MPSETDASHLGRFPSTRSLIRARRHRRRRPQARGGRWRARHRDLARHRVVGPTVQPSTSTVERPNRRSTISPGIGRSSRTRIRSAPPPTDGGQRGHRAQRAVTAALPRLRYTRWHVRVCVPEAVMEMSTADHAAELIAKVRGDVEAMMAQRGWVLAQALTGPRSYQITRKNGNVLFEASTFRDLRAWLLKQPSRRGRAPRVFLVCFEVAALGRPQRPTELTNGLPSRTTCSTRSARRRKRSAVTRNSSGSSWLPPANTGRRGNRRESAGHEKQAAWARFGKADPPPPTAAHPRRTEMAPRRQGPSWACRHPRQGLPQLEADRYGKRRFVSLGAVEKDVGHQARLTVTSCRTHLDAPRRVEAPARESPTPGIPDSGVREGAFSAEDAGSAPGARSCIARRRFVALSALPSSAPSQIDFRRSVKSAISASSTLPITPSPIDAALPVIWALVWTVPPPSLKVNVTSALA